QVIQGAVLRSRMHTENSHAGRLLPIAPGLANQRRGGPCASSRPPKQMLARWSALVVGYRSLPMALGDNVVRVLGRYSEGLRLTVEHGPSSGVVLEYAYQNTPQGSGVLGRWIDRTFLHLNAWESIR